MPHPYRCLTLLAVLAVGVALSTAVMARPTAASARWPSDHDRLFQVEGWATESVRVDPGTEVALLQRTYRDTAGNSAQVVVWTTPQPHAKQLFRKGPDRDFLGAGYSTETAPAGLVPAIPGGGALIARQGQQAWLLLYTFGERRGTLGAGLPAWGLAELDSLLDRPNDYFLARIGVPFEAAEPPPVEVATSLAEPLFARLTTWYATESR